MRAKALMFTLMLKAKHKQTSFFRGNKGRQAIRNVIDGKGGGGLDGEFLSCMNFVFVSISLRGMLFRMQEHFFWATRCA